MERISTTTTATRRLKWQYPPAPPTPRILHLPRRHRKRLTKTTPTKPTLQKDRKGKLETLFDQERSFSRGAVSVPVVLVRTEECEEEEEEKRERVEENGGGGGLVMVEAEKWRFQAEMLRAECNLLRMEREIAVKKMERRRVQMERTLRSAVQTLLSGRKKICEGKNASLVLEEEIQDLVEKLEKLQTRSGVKDLEVRDCSNFDKQASFLQRRLEKFGGISGEVCAKEIQEMAEASLSIKTRCKVDESFVSNSNFNVEILRRKMEGLSKGVLLERMEEEYGSMLSTTNSSATSSVSTSKRIEYPDVSLSSIRQPHKEKMAHEKKVCSGRCKAIVRRIVEQVRVETEQWSQMQEMLGQVRDEMEELQASRDFWEDRALDSECQIQFLHSAVQEWRQKALSSESKATELQAQITVLRVELERLRKEKVRESVRAKNSPPFPGDAPNETEKRVLVCCLKENHHTNDDGCRQKESFSDGRRKVHTFTSGLAAPKRSPLRDIGNVSPLVRQNSKAIFPLHCPYKEDNF